ncbi:hypothetical protein GCM10009821_22530 [Aeromicrobium halocynthiae]|uniref:O-antigen ligase family protein n=1 Tax=Aeromicrobium halocynthiae TaxID=560557 RepID=A0ABN2W2Y0_9ACTN
MSSGARTDARRRAVLLRVVSALPAVLVALVLYAWLPLAAASVALGLAGAAAVGGLALVLVLGFERSAVVLLAAAFATAPLNAVRPVPGLGFVTLADLLLLLAIGLLLPVLVTRRLSGQALLVGGALGVVVVSLVTSVLAPDPLTSLNTVMRLVVGALALPFVFAVWRAGRTVLALLAGSYVLGNVFNVIWSVTLGDVSDEGRRIGLSMHVNILGFCAMLAVALVPYLLTVVPVRWRWTVVLAGGVCAYGVWTSGSRAALVVTVAVAVLYPVVARSVPVAIALFGGGVAALWFLGSALDQGRAASGTIGRIFGAGTASASDLAREIEAQRAIDEFLRHPVIGNGFSADLLEAHNIYLQIAAAGGLLLVACYLVLLAAVVVQPLRLDPRHHLLVLPAAAYLLIGPLTPLLWDRYIWCVLALPFLLARPRQADAATDEDSSTEELVTS